MAQDTASVQPREFQRLAVPFEQEGQAHQGATINIVPEKTKGKADTILEGFRIIAVAYESACSLALSSLTARASLSQDEADRISAEHESVIQQVQGYLSRLMEWREAMAPEHLSFLVDGNTKFKESWAKVEEAHKLTETLNDPQQVQRLRDETPARMARIVAFYEQRYEAFEDGLRSAHETATFWNYDRETIEVRRRFVANRVARWWRWKQGVRAQLEDLKRSLPVSLHKDLDPEHPGMTAGTRLKQQTDEMFVDLYDAAAADQTEGMDMDEDESVEGTEDDGDESEWEEFVLEEDTTPPLEEWSDEELDDLKDRLGQPFPIIIITAERGYEERPRYERHVLDNHCVICVDDIDDPCMLSTCDHVFCYKCIVHALRTGKPCPTCQQPGQLDDLTPLDVTIVGQRAEMEVNGGDEGTVTAPQDGKGSADS